MVQPLGDLPPPPLDLPIRVPGCRTDLGCCPLNCTHVWGYEYTLARVFPALDRKMRETDLVDLFNAADGTVFQRCAGGRGGGQRVVAG